MSGCFEVHQSPLPPVGSLQKAGWGPDDGEMKEAYGIGSPRLLFLEWVCPLAPTSALFFLKCSTGRRLLNMTNLWTWRMSRRSSPVLTHYHNYYRNCSAAVSFSLQVRAEASQSWLARAISAGASLAGAGGVKRSGAVTSHSTLMC